MTSMKPSIPVSESVSSVDMEIGSSWTDSNTSISSTNSYEAMVKVIQTKPRFHSIKDAIHNKILNLRAEGRVDERSFYICDIGEIRRQLNLWKSELPFIKPYYAVKCNPNEEFIKNMISIEPEMGFDCASLAEIETILRINRFINRDNLIYANPIKPISQLRYANNNDVNLTTIDSIEEVEKIANFTDGKMKVLIRIQTDDSSATCPLSVKFGANLQYSEKIVKKCIQLGVQIRGVAFHVGSGFKDSNTLGKAVDDSYKVIEIIEKNQGNKCDIIDVGGGFSKDSFKESAKILRKEMEFKFGKLISNGEIKVISELGRFLSASCFTLVSNVIGTREEIGGGKTRVYLNDGLYGNLNCILYDHQEVEPIVITSNGEFVYQESKSNDKKLYSIWGPTCDGLDCISKRVELNYDIKCGDFIGFENCGAYTNAAATKFNGFTNEFDYEFIES